MHILTIILQLILIFLSPSKGMTSQNSCHKFGSEVVCISCWNTRGYLTSIPYFKQLLTRCDILAISEHWIFENRLFKLSQITDSHYCFAQSTKLASAEEYGTGRGQGGVAIFGDSKMTGISAVTDIVLDRACTVRLQTKTGAIFYFISVYLPAQLTGTFLR